MALTIWRNNIGQPTKMRQFLLHVALVVRDYDEAIESYCPKLHFTLVENAYQAAQD